MVTTDNSDEFLSADEKNNVIVLSKEAYDAFEAMLDAPPNPKVAASLEKLLSRPAPWDRAGEVGSP